ncbi:MAG: response regulator transcription factor [Sediminispirochaetaceae bacterium]
MYRILIADDERLEREALKFILNKGLDYPLEIQEAANGREAIVKSRSFQPDIVFMDIKMPGIDGMEASAGIREELPRVQLIFLTAFNRFEYAREAIHLGACDYLVKPSSESSVLETTERVIRKVEQMKKELDSRRNNELKLSRAAEYLENEFVYTAAMRGIRSGKFMDYIAIMDLTFKSGRGGVMKLFYDSYPLQVESDYQRTILKRRCSLILKKRFAREGIRVLANIELAVIYFLVIIPEEANLERIDFDEVLNDTAVRIRQDLSIDVHIGIGTGFTDPRSCLESFSTAGRSEGGREHDSAYPMDLEMAMEKAVMKVDRGEADSVYAKIRDWFYVSDTAEEEKKQFILELTTVLRHSAAFQSPSGIITGTVPNLSVSDPPDQLISSFRLFVNTLLSELEHIREIENDPAVEQGCRYIEENYSKDISLEDAAAYCGLSSFYFSRLFKRKKQITFIDYLTKRRIEEARRLLAAEELSIKEISSRIGYSDPNYFTRVFRRVEGVSPSAYRSRIIRKGQ